MYRNGSTLYIATDTDILVMLVDHGSTFSAFIYVFWWLFGVSVKKYPRRRCLFRFWLFCVCRLQLIDDLEKHAIDKVMGLLFTNVNILPPAEFCGCWFMFGVKYWSQIYSSVAFITFCQFFGWKYSHLNIAFFFKNVWR